MATATPPPAARISAGRSARSTAAPPGEGPRPATLADLVATLSADVLDVLAAPAGLDVEVGEVVIHDAAEPDQLRAGDVVLGVGVRGGDPAARALLRDAAEQGAAAVVLKVEEPVPGELVAAAAASGVALLSARRETAWGQLHALLRTAVAGADAALRAGESHAPVGDLFGLANAVAAWVGGPVTIEDPQSRVLAYSNLGHAIDDARRQTILGRRIPDEWLRTLRDDGVFARLLRGELVRTSYGGLQGRLAIGVRAGGELLGSIWAADGGEPFADTAESALTEAARIAALHLVRHRVGADLERRMRGEVLRGLLEGRGPVSVLAERLGLDLATPATVVAFELQDGEEAEIAMRRERVLDLVATYCEAFRRRVAQVAIGRTIYALLPTPAAGRADGVHRLATDVVERARGALSVTVLAGIGSTVSGLAEVPRSRSQADQVLRVLGRRPGDGPVAAVEDVHAHAVLLELEDLLAERPHLTSAKLARLAEHDARQDAAYLATLHAYLSNFGDVIAGARALHVHPNTFRYRLRRLLEVSGLDLSDPDERIVTELQLRVLPGP